MQQAVWQLVEAWCDRRCLRALREILGAPVVGLRLTDDWALLVSALEGVRAFAKGELTEEEAVQVDQLIGAASAIAFDR